MVIIHEIVCLYFYLEFVFLPVDDDGGDLLIHEDEDDGQQRGQRSSQ